MNGSRSIGKMAIGGVLGVVLAITATQAWQATAAPGDTDSTYVPVQPCRLLDMRPGTEPAAGKKTPLGAGVANVFTQQVTGNVGSCVGIPSGAVAVAMNVTIANPTAQSFLTVYPADQALPNASNLNWVAGGSPTPNKVDVRLSADGKINLFNETGTVNVIADVVGYYTRSSLIELNERVAALEATPTTPTTTTPTPVTILPVVEYAGLADEISLSLAGAALPATETLTVTLNAPSAGKVAVVANATAKNGVGLNPRLVCQITDDPAATNIDGNEVLGIASPASDAGANGTYQPTLGTNRVFDVAEGLNTFDLMCTATGTGGVTIHYRSMTATFTPNG